jgi:YebC/PmpR family DNA-binding regulatory protein
MPGRLTFAHHLSKIGPVAKKKLFMSGHSKWSQINHKKGAADAKRSAIFTKVANMITVAARVGGGDPRNNPRLDVAIAKARAVNMPNDNIERAIKRGTGELEGVTLESLELEAYGPGGSALIIEAITDNKNRTITELRNVLSRHGGKLAESGSVIYQFAKKGVIRLKSYSANAELQAIDAGAEDTKQVDGHLEIYTKPENLSKVKEKFPGVVGSADLEYLPQNPIALSGETKKQTELLLAAIAEQVDVNEIYSNLA